jgi:hypothetical protein
MLHLAALEGSFNHSLTTSHLTSPFLSPACCSIHSVPLSGMHGMHRFGDGTAHTLIIYVYAHTGG